MKVIAPFGGIEEKKTLEYITTIGDDDLLRCNNCMTYFLCKKGSYKINSGCKFCERQAHKSLGVGEGVGSHQKYGKLRLLAFIDVPTTNGLKAVFKCDCGSIVVRAFSSARQGYSQNCGCMHAPEKYDFVFEGKLAPLVYSYADLVQMDKLVVEEFTNQLNRVSDIQSRFDSSQANIFGSILTPSEEVVGSEDEEEVAEQPVEEEEQVEEQVEGVEEEVVDEPLLTPPADPGKLDYVYITNDLVEFLKSAGCLSRINKDSLVDILVEYGDAIKLSRLYDLALGCVINKEDDSLRYVIAKSEDRKLSLGLIEKTRSSYIFYGHNTSQTVKLLNGYLTKNPLGEYINEVRLDLKENGAPNSQVEDFTYIRNNQVSGSFVRDLVQSCEVRPILNGDMRFIAGAIAVGCFTNSRKILLLKEALKSFSEQNLCYVAVDEFNSPCVVLLANPNSSIDNYIVLGKKASYVDFSSGVKSGEIYKALTDKE